MITDSFSTGSRVYGKPRPDSDWDIAIRCDRQDAASIFGANLDGDPDDPNGYPIDENAWTCLRGNVNYILCFTDKRFNSWKEGTNKLILIAPVDRELAKAIFISLFKAEKK